MPDNYHFAIFDLYRAFLLDLRNARLNVLSHWISTSFSLFATCFNSAAKLHVFYEKRTECAIFF